MQYRLNQKNGDSLSLLGFGCLRFPRKNGKIDFEETQREILEAVRLGVNYFDTAYVYGGSEETLGKILAQNGIRKSVYIATKLPHYYIKKTEDFERFFAEELQRLQTDYV
ncbi:MAG: aldo/keto reductase, partial [Lachnospiraceae bacterium]